MALVSASLDQAFDQMASDLVATALDAVTQRGVFHLAISGDDALQPLLDRMMLDPGLRTMPWKLTHVWQADERCDEHGEGGCAWRRISDTLVPHAGLGRGHAHPMPAMDEVGPEHYARRMRRTMGRTGLDCVVLRAEPDGTLGGMLQGHEFDGSPLAFVRHGQGSKVTMTPSLVGKAGSLMVLVDEGDARRQIDRDLPVERSPIASVLRQGVHPSWYISSPAMR
ncbi:MAG: 6-phosphogluconolactonase [Phycisphaerales bacterium]|nr:6-phosphogluconolactonase [Phycisphaerales bacterium]